MIDDGGAYGADPHGNWYLGPIPEWAKPIVLIFGGIVLLVAFGFILKTIWKSKS